MNINPDDGQIDAMANLVAEAVTNAKEAMIVAAQKGADDYEIYGIMTLAVCNVMADHLMATAAQPDYRVSEVSMAMFQEIVVPQLEAVSKRVKDRK